MLIPLLFIILISAGYYFARVAIYPKVNQVDYTFAHEIEVGNINEAEYRQWTGEEHCIRSPYGYDLFAIYYAIPGSKKTVVISHGITWSLYGSVKYAALFYKRGYNVLLYDLRHHGRSGGENTTFGLYEKYDLKAVVDWAFQRLGPGGSVGTLGESLGAGVTLQHAAIDKRIVFAIADCPYSDLMELFKLRLMKEYHLPAFPLLPVASWISGLLTGMRIDQISPLRTMPAIETPLMFIHGQEDTYILPKMSVDLFRAKTSGPRKLYLAPQAGHAGSLSSNPEEYDRQVGEFLFEIGLN